MVCGFGSDATAEELLGQRRAFDIAWEEANFLHHVHISILEPEYVDNDISFINWAFPVHIERLGEALVADTARLMLEFYEGVPEHLRSQITWHPTPEFRQLAAKRHT
jgi:hypothetical protein